ncbi:MAG: WD40 repeat domain-containing protein [Candidatus Thorarchaeota archaeon]
MFLYEIPSGQLIKKISCFQTVISSLVFPPNSQFLATCDYRYLKILGLKKMEITYSRELIKGYTHNLAFSPDNYTVAIISDHKVQSFDINSINFVETIDLKPKGIYGISYSPKGDLIAIGSADKKIRIWSLS